MLIGDVGYINTASIYYNFHDENIVTHLSEEQLIKNAKFIKNIRRLMERTGYDTSFIESSTCKLVERYIFFISAGIS